MTNTFIAIGMFCVVLVVGLSGCNDSAPPKVAISKLSANPEQYLGQEVTVEGDCHDFSKKIFDENGTYFYFISKTALNGEYRIIGTVMFANKVYLINVSEAIAL